MSFWAILCIFQAYFYYLNLETHPLNLNQSQLVICFGGLMQTPATARGYLKNVWNFPYFIFYGGEVK